MGSPSRLLQQQGLPSPSPQPEAPAQQGLLAWDHVDPRGCTGMGNSHLTVCKSGLRTSTHTGPQLRTKNSLTEPAGWPLHIQLTEDIEKTPGFASGAVLLSPGVHPMIFGTVGLAILSTPIS
ncbi:hypothetical protein Y1Q_0003006 [Alligator mississippiensis]|uniref:Uncharacterized protein n=1 Tax=Alligator mississippiensis TaxID=8496 RepID=A0A151MD53_ALLMI|nr:hypothetical protein Y1Q_0003006 [Alligator mississippiensis]